MGEGGRIRAVVGLLDDDSPSVAGAAADALCEMAQAAPGRVREAVEAGSPRQRLIGRQLLESVRLGDLEREMAGLALRLYDTESLERGTVLLARLRYPELDAAEVSGALDELAEQLASRLPAPGADAAATWGAFRQVLFTEVGFAGNTGSYYEPDNSYINRVLERRTGIPISLAVVVLFLARRLSVPMVGVGMPYHFLVRLEGPDQRLLIDPFGGGRTMTRRDCQDVLASLGAPFHESYLAPTPPRQILVRMINNLVGIYSQDERHNLVAALAGFLQALSS